MAAAATTAPQHLFALNVGPDGAHAWCLLTKAGADLSGRPSWERGSWKLLYAGSGCWELQGPGLVTSTPTSSVLPFGAGLEWKQAKWPENKWLVGPVSCGGVLEKALLQAIQACYDEWAAPGPAEELPARVLVVAQASDKTKYWCPVLTKSATTTNGCPTWQCRPPERWRLCVGPSGQWELSANFLGKVQCETLQSGAARPVGAGVSWRAAAGMHTSKYEIVTVLPWFQADDAQGRLLASASRIMEPFMLPMEEVIQGFSEAQAENAALQVANKDLSTRVEELLQQVSRHGEETAALQVANQQLSSRVEELLQEAAKQDAAAKEEERAAQDATGQDVTARELLRELSRQNAAMQEAIQGISSTIREAREESAAIQPTSQRPSSILGSLTQCLCGLSLVPAPTSLWRSPVAQLLRPQVAASELQMAAQLTELHQKLDDLCTSCLSDS